jgi:3,4-dihydroxy 2-butanone 4-phosphate synthase / GTP cyclohydrolase II
MMGQPLARDGMIVGVGAEPLASVHGDFVLHRFHDVVRGAAALALAAGDLAGDAPLPARVHSACLTGDGLGALDCDCAAQLGRALAAIAAGGRGVLFYLAQDGRGAGVAAKALDRMLVQASGNRLDTFAAYARLGLPADRRTYGEVAPMARLLGVTAPLRLLSNNPAKAEALRAAGVAVERCEPLEPATSPWNRRMLEAKRGDGHTLAADPRVDAAVLPEPVVAIDPTPLATAPHVVRVATHLLPLPCGPSVAWFRLHLHVDLRTGGEHIVLTHGQAGDTVLVRIQREHVRERFALRAPRLRPTFDAALAAIARHGHGVLLLIEGDDDPPPSTGALLAEHVGTGRATPLLVAGDDDRDAALVRDALSRSGGQGVVARGDYRGA